MIGNGPDEMCGRVYFNETLGGLMSKVNEHIGGRIRMYRKARGMTLQQLADSIQEPRQRQQIRKRRDHAGCGDTV